MTTEPRTKRPKRNTGGLKMLLFASSIMATLTGTQLLNIKAALQPADPIAERQSITTVQAEPQFVVVLVPTEDGGQQAVLRPIQQSVQPQFRSVARTRSSS